MNFQKKRYKLAGNFIVVYVLIVSLLSGIFIFSFNLYRDYISRFEIGLETGSLVAEISPLIERALQSGDTVQAMRLARLLFSSASVACVQVTDNTGLVLAWPPGGVCGGAESGRNRDASAPYLALSDTVWPGCQRRP